MLLTKLNALRKKEYVHFVIQMLILVLIRKSNSSPCTCTLPQEILLIVVLMTLYLYSQDLNVSTLHFVLILKYVVWILYSYMRLCTHTTSLFLTSHSLKPLTLNDSVEYLKVSQNCYWHAHNNYHAMQFFVIVKSDHWFGKAMSSRKIHTNEAGTFEET